MEEINRQNEEIMNMELSAMTGFSLVLSIPILYLCWVAFFSDYNEGKGEITRMRKG